MAAGPRTDLPDDALPAATRPALADVSVIEYGDGPASALAGMLLSDAGAFVVKVEPPQGARERVSGAHRVWDRGKHSFVLDPTSAASADALYELVRAADVLIVQQPTKRADTIIDVAESSAIVCRITGFGAHGAMAGRGADDSTIAAYAGLCSDQAGWLPGPSYLAHLLPSTATAILTVQRVVAALIQRGWTGAGAVMETALLSSVFAMSGQVRGGLVPRPRALSSSPRGSSPFYSLFECQDGAWVQLGCLHAGFVKKAIDALDLREQIQPLTEDPRFGDGVTIASDEINDPLLAAMDGTFLRHTRAHWLARLDEGDVPAAPVLSSRDFLGDPQAAFNGLAVVDDPDVGPAIEPGPFVRLSRSGHAIGAGAPRLGSYRPATDGQPLGGATGVDGAAGGFALSGITVLELSNIIAGPMVGRCLADLGADVVKLESPEGDIFRQQLAPEFLPLNAGKRSICLDLKDPHGNACGRRLAASADVVVNNMRPGVAERLGMGWDAVRAANPAAVYCQVTAFGAAGPYAARPGGDPLAGALTGMQHAQGEAVGKPVYLRGAPIDNIAGMLGALGVLLALRERQQSGVGQLVDTSLLDAGALLNCHRMVSPGSMGNEEPAARSQYGPNALQRLYQAADGWLYLHLRGQDEVEAFCRELDAGHILADPRFATPERRERADPALADAIGAVLTARAVAAACGSLHRAGLRCVPLRDAPGDLDDEQARANGWVQALEHPSLGTIRVFRGWSDGNGPVHLRPPPLLGQHGPEVLRERGFTDSDIRSLTQTGALRVPEPREGVM